MSYILICEMVTQVCLLWKNIPQSLSLGCAVYYTFYFNFKNEDLRCHRRKFQHRMLGLPWPLQPHSALCHLLCGVQTQSSPFSSRTSQRVQRELRVCSSVLCEGISYPHPNSFLIPIIVINFFMWVYFFLLDEFSGVRVHFHDFSFTWSLSFLKVAIPSHNTQDVLYTQQLVLSRVWRKDHSWGHWHGYA